MSDIVIRAVTSASPVIKATVSASPVIKPSNAVGPQGIPGPKGENGDVVGPETSVGDNFASWDGTGGNTLKDSGSKASDFANKSTLTTKGDLYVRDATGVTRLPVGSNGEVLKADSSQAEGVAWGAPDDPVTFATTSEVTGVHTTGSVTSGSTSMTVASATGIVAGMYVVGEGIAPGTTVATVSGTTVTLSENAGRTLSSDPVGFYVADKVLSPGLTAGMLCRAWVNFNGTGTVAIRAAMNVSSITDNGVGKYTVNFTTAMPDANFVTVVSAKRTNNASFATDNQSVVANPTTPDVGSVLIGVSAGSSVFDAELVFVSIFR